MAHILVADDDPRIRTGLRLYAEHGGYVVSEARTGAEAIAVCSREPIDLIIMDVMMPEVDGFTACQRIRAERDIPVLMLSARGEEYDRLYGFESGVDDYVVKPFSLREVMARVRVILDRHPAAGSGSANAVASTKEISKQKELTLRYQGLEISKSARTLRVNGAEKALTPREFDLLLYFTANPNRACSREDILQAVWGYDYLGDPRTVDTHIKTLRRSLGPYKSFIQTLRGYGYRFTPGHGRQ